MTTATMETTMEVLTRSSISEEAGAMFHTFIRSAVGYKKLRNGKTSEDSIKALRLKNASICAVADGHGDSSCKYSGIGAEIATKVACDVMRAIYQGCPDDEALYEYCANNRDTIAKQIIRHWNQAVFEDYLSKTDFPKLKNGREKMLLYIQRLFNEQSKVRNITEARAYYEEQSQFEETLKKITHFYGTTLNIVVKTQSFIFCMGIGDGDIISVQGKTVDWLLPPSEQFSTKTQSLCWRPQKALEAFRSVIIRKTRGRQKSKLFETGIKPDYIIIASDGFRNSFVSDEVFADKLLEINKENQQGYKKFQRHSQAWIEQLTKDSLYQDDISLGFIFE